MVVPLREVMFGDVRPILLMLLGGAGLLLLSSGINVVSLLLARSDSRTREIAVRDALGASSARLILQFATEAVVLVVVGSALGLIFAAWGMRFLQSLLSAEMIARMPYLQNVALNGRLVAFTLAVAFVAAVTFALTPVLRVPLSTRFNGLKEGGRGSAGTTWRRFGAYLVVAELATAVILLVSAGLLGKSLYLLLRVDIGLNPDHLATLSVSAPPGGPALTAANLGAWQQYGIALARQVADRVGALPGVQAVGYADQLPLSQGSAPASVFWIVGRPAEEQRDSAHPVRRVSADYFSTLQAKLLRGRYFTEEEVASRRPVMVINQTTAQRYFPDEDPLGKSIVFGPQDGTDSGPERAIVGVIADIKDGPLEAPAWPAAYVPFDQNSFALVVRTSRAAEALFPSLTAAIQEARPGVVVSRTMTTMSERIEAMPSAHLHRSSAWMVGGFAAMALLLSVVGFYGVVAYSVGQRTREIGVRMALGAQPRSVYRLVMGEAVRLVSAGTAVGLICAVIAATLMRRLLFGVQSWDAQTLAAAGGTLVFASLLASYIPARRAASVNPIQVLRGE
jgi:predicted permease